jgi:ribosomal protein S27AE
MTMFGACGDDRSPTSARPIPLWALADGTRCTLAKNPDDDIELRLVDRDLLVIRRALYLEVVHALEAAREWRLDYEIEREARSEAVLRVQCPQCGDDAFSGRDHELGLQWFYCGSCGEIWGSAISAPSSAVAAPGAILSPESPADVRAEQRTVSPA